MSGSTRRLAATIHMLGQTLQSVDPQKEPGLWNLHKVVWQLAREVDQDIADMERRIWALENTAAGSRAP